MTGVMPRGGARPPVEACSSLRGRDRLSIRDLTREELLGLQTEKALRLALLS
jgi:hypothetical protein